MTLTFKAKRDAVLSYFRTKEPLDFEGLRIQTGLEAYELRVILNELVNSREVRRIEDKYKRVEIGRRLRSWQLRRYDPNKVLTVDVETTGLDRSYDDVLQLAIVEYDEDVRLNGFYGSSRPDWPEAT